MTKRSRLAKSSTATEIRTVNLPAGSQAFYHYTKSVPGTYRLMSKCLSIYQFNSEMPVTCSEISEWSSEVVHTPKANRRQIQTQLLCARAVSRSHGSHVGADLGRSAVDGQRNGSSDFLIGLKRSGIWGHS